MPSSGGPLRLFAKPEENAIPFVLECSSWGSVQFRGALRWPNAPNRPPQNITTRNYTIRQTRTGTRPRFRATYKITLHLSEWLLAECLDEDTQKVLYTWDVTTHNAGPDRAASEPAYLTLVQRSEKDVAVPTMSCRSGVYDDVRLQVIRCDTPEQCRLLEWCFDSDAEGCGAWIVQNGTECLDIESRACEELAVPQPGGLFRCTAGGYSYSQLRWRGLSGNQSYPYKQADGRNVGLEHEILRAKPEIADGRPFYTRLIHVFSFEMHSFFVEAQARVFVGFSNQTGLQPAQTHNILATGPYDAQPLTQNTDVIFSSSATNRLICMAPKRGALNEWIATSIENLQIADSIEPAILNDKSVFSFADDGEQKTIECVASGLPAPEIVWTKWAFDGSTVVIGPTLQRGMQTVNGSTLRWVRFTKDYEGTFECSADNGVGVGVKMNFTASLPLEGGGGNGGGGESVWVGVGGAAAAILLILVPVGLLVRYVFRKRVLDKETIQLFRYGVQEEAETETEVETVAESAQPPDMPSAATIPGESEEPTATNAPEPRSTWLTHVDRSPFDKRFEISRWKFKIDKKRPLGKGEFGIVYAGTVTLQGHEAPLNVAIKVNRKNCPEASLAGLLKEIKYMTYLQHENVVSLIGANTAQAEYGQLYILMELCEEGSLEQFLQQKQRAYVDETKKPTQRPLPVASHFTIIETKTFGHRELGRWCAEVAAGMEYLASKGIVHRDLAARNVLLTAEWKAKVSDFGLSRQLYGTAAYHQKSTELQLPLRWMASECFRGVFSTQSDVWAFGVTVWEIFSLGKLPYADTDFTDPAQFYQLLCGGLRIEQRHKATEEIFSRLSECWQQEPTQCPSFSHLKHFFKE